jgi:hypothetical protein
MKKYDIVVIVFNFDFEGEMNFLVLVCVHEKNVIKRNMKQKSCKDFNLVQVTND